MNREVLKAEGVAPPVPAVPPVGPAPLSLAGWQGPAVLMCVCVCAHACVCSSAAGLGVLRSRDLGQPFEPLRTSGRPRT